MSAADWALVISLFSLVLSIAAFVWSVWSHFIYPMPRVRVNAAIMRHVNSPTANDRPFISVNASNYGPNEVTLYLALATTHLWPHTKTRGLMVLNPLINPIGRPVTTGPFTGLPQKIGVGESHAAHFDISLKLASKTQVVRGLGFSDTFDRYHLVRGRRLRKFLDQLRAEQAQLGLPSDQDNDMDLQAAAR